jgi:hypothetical protein
MEEMLQFGGGLLYPPGDVNTLCNLLLPLVVSLQARMELGEQARQAVEKHFSFDAMLSAFESRVLNSGEHTSVPDV